MGPVVFDRRWYWLAFFGVFGLAMAFAIYTNHAWEDFYITYRASKNLALGNGLLFTVGQRVHSFTSPLGTLLPALLSAMTGNNSDLLVLWLFRIASSLALGGTAVLLLRMAAQESFVPFAAAVLIGLFGLDAKSLDFSINGMETAFLLLFLALTLYALVVPTGRPAVWLGIGWAGLMWSRPDGFVYVGSVALGFLLFQSRSRVWTSRRDLLKLFVTAGLLTVVLYGPWILWAWWYYGTPVPNTITAKGLGGFGIHSWNELLTHLSDAPITRGKGVFYNAFLPTYECVGGWNRDLDLYGLVLVLICGSYWLFPFGRPVGRAFSFAFMGLQLYLNYICPLCYPWYIPGCTFLGFCVLAQIVQQCHDRAGQLQGQGTRERLERMLMMAARCTSAMVLGVSLALTLCSAYQLKIQQTEIEEGNRKQIGLWLRDHARSTQETVFLEPLGYIGYFSQLKMYDFPGLSSPEMLAARRKLGSNWAVLIPYLRPDWLVLRPVEVRLLNSKDPAVLEAYEPAQSFDATARLNAYNWLPGYGYVMCDRTFIVFRRKGV